MAIRLPSAEPRGFAAGHPINVLVVDDGLGVTTGVRGLLGKQPDLLVSTVSSSAEAETAVARRAFDVVLLEARFWEGDAGYLRPLVENDARQLAAVVAGPSVRDRRRRQPQQYVTADPASLMDAEYLPGLIRSAAAAARAARRKQTMLRWLERESRSDELTGLPDRAALDAELADVCGLARQAGSPVGLLLVNVVGTGSVNAAYGREAGDRMILRAVHGITRSVRATDFAARLGDDDFAIILPAAGIDVVRRIARRITHQVERLNMSEWADEIPVEVTFGAASGSGCTAENLLKAAEAQLHDHDHAHAAPTPPWWRPADDDGPSVA